jgi:hypothetical protein
MSIGSYFMQKMAMENDQRIRTEDYQDKLRQADKVSRAMYDFMTPAAGLDGSQPAHPLGPKEQWNNASAEDRVTRSRGYVEAQTLQRAMQEAQSMIAERAAQTNRMALENRGTAALPRFATDQAAGDLAGAVGNTQSKELMAALENRGRAPMMPGSSSRIMAALENNGRAPMMPGSSGQTPRFAITPEMLRPNPEERTAAAAAPVEERTRFATLRNPEVMMAPQYNNILKAVELQQPQETDPVKAMFAEANLINAQANMTDAQRRSAPAVRQPDSSVRPDPYAALDYKALVADEMNLQKQLSAARGKKQFDLAAQLAGELNSVLLKKGALRGGSNPSAPAATAAPYPDGTRLKGPNGKMYVVKNGQPVAE